MKVWLIQTGEDVPFESGVRKLRTAVLAEELASRGHEVVWWAAAFSHLRKKWIKTEKSERLSSGVQIELLHGSGYQKNVSLARIIDHRLVAREFKKRSVCLPVPDIIVCGLPPYDLAYGVARYSQEHDIPLILDARDYWPDIFLTVVPEFFRPLARFLLQNEFRQTRYAFRAANSVTAMSEDVLEWALSYCERRRKERDKVFHLGYKPAPDSREASPDWLQQLNGRFIVAFIGTFSPYHGPAVLLNVAKRLLGVNRTDIAIVIAGAGGDRYDEIKSRAEELPNITLTGWLEQDEINVLLGRAALGICPTSMDACFFPNKTFLYFSRGLPVLSAFDGELRKLLENDGLGAYYPPDDGETLTNQILNFCDDRDHYQRTRDRVERAFAERFDEKIIYSGFADHIENVAESGRSDVR